MEESCVPVQNPVPCKPGTRANPAVEEENSSDEGDDVLIPIYSGSPVPTVCESPVEPDLLLTNVQDTQRAEPPGLHPVKSPETAQNARRIPDIDNLPDIDNPPDIDNLPDIDNPPDIDNLPDLDQNSPDMSNSTSDGPLILTESNSYQSDTECLPKSTEQVEKTAFTQEELPEVEYPSIQGEQPLVPAKITASTEENGSKSAESEEDGTVLMDEAKEKKETDMNDFVRRSERNRQPPKRLDYPELVSAPVIKVISNHSSRVVLQCESAGWYPEPELLWLDSEGNLLSAGPTETLRGPDDLYTVSSRVTVEKRHSNNVICRVQQKDINQSRETHIHVPGTNKKHLLQPQQILALLGDDVILPCSLKTPTDASHLQLEWARTDLSPGFIHVWEKIKENVEFKQPSYVGRTSLSSDKLKHGDVSLTLSKVQLSDEGPYRCFIPQLPLELFVDLIVGSVSAPVIKVISNHSSKVVLQCESAGWYPEPELLWLDGEGNLLSAGPTETLRGPDDLYTVSSRVTVEKRHSNNITCRVQQKNINQSRETHIHVPVQGQEPRRTDGAVGALQGGADPMLNSFFGHLAYVV
ncbi:butyrophilin-like protein 2 [Archocentrus centrarchus]|uniref:butyrophilin-like protein 2 n=1 Tax=Archocentrus centrarchus TaxID=63155 RepID=UPI0011E9FEAE|nr:butyrophilin-like protein 2 [Archocentrus centrarchus]